jgi:hypothetical protein
MKKLMGIGAFTFCGISFYGMAQQPSEKAPTEQQQSSTTTPEDKQVPTHLCSAKNIDDLVAQLNLSYEEQTEFKSWIARNKKVISGVAISTGLIALAIIALYFINGAQGSGAQHSTGIDAAGWKAWLASREKIAS